MSIYYVKLVTGEEIVGTLVRRGDSLAVVDPMTMEYGENEAGSRFIFMTRYNQYAEDKTVWLDRRSIVFMSKTLTEVEKYYETSLDHCRRVTDVDFRKGLARASQSVYQSSVEQEEEVVEFDPDFLTTKTLH